MLRLILTTRCRRLEILYPARVGLGGARRRCSARTSHLGVAEQHRLKIFHGAANIHLLEVIVPTGCGDLTLKLALKLSARHTIDAKEVVRRTAIRLMGVLAVGDDVDARRFQ